MKEKVIVRIKTKLSFAGEIIGRELKNGEEGVFLKTSSYSNILIWIPLGEIESIIKPTSEIIEGETLNEIKF